jgi:long-subunit acyl-CoA synthetase (AMP-forming)
VTTYGQTESCGGVVYDGTPLAGIEIAIGDDDEILLRGPTSMRGYRLDPDATAQTLTGDGWLRTGDAGVMVDGRLEV